MERWGFMLLVATIAGTVYFLPDCFVDRYFTSGQLWVCGIAGAWGIFALWRAKRCSYLGMAVGGVLLVAWGYGFVSGYLGWQALGWRVALWLLLLVAENDWQGIKRIAESFVQQNDWESLKKKIGKNSMNIEITAQGDTIQYYKQVINFYDYDNYNYALGSSTINFTEGGQAVGIYDDYDFDFEISVEALTKRTIQNNVLTIGVNVLGKIYNAEDYKIVYGIWFF